MDKKIGFINIHNDSDRVSSSPFQGKYISLASMKLAGHLLQNGISEENVHILPADYSKSTSELVNEISDKVDSLLLDYIGFTAYSWNSQKTSEIVEKLLTTNNRVKIAIGGPNVRNLQINGNRIIKVIGKGENPILDIIRREEELVLTEDSFYQGVIGNSSIENNDTLINSEQPLYYSENILNCIEEKDWIDNRFGWYQTGDGCPYKCGFCAYDFEKLGLDTYDLEKIKNEISNIKKLGIRRLFIIDPIFGVKRNRGKEILKLFNEMIPDVELIIFMRTEFLDDEYINILSKSNIKQLRIGIQSLNPNIPKWLRSNKLNLVYKNLSQLSKNGIPWRSELIVGMIGDTMEGLKQTYKTVVNDFNPTTLYGYHLTVINNTELADYKDKFDQDTWIKADKNGSAIESSSYTEEEMKQMLVYSNMLTGLHRHIKKGKKDIKINIDFLESYIELAGGISKKENIEFFLNADYIECEKFWIQYFND